MVIAAQKPTPLVLKPNNNPDQNDVTSREELEEEDYHGGSPAAVPFTWESQPGTPKASFRRRNKESDLPPPPPLTPPPSYFYSSPHFATPMRSPPPSASAANKKNKKKRSKRKFLDAVNFFSKPWVSSSKPKSKPADSPVYSSSSSYSSSSVPSSPLTCNNHNAAAANSAARKSSFADMILTEDQERRRRDNEAEDEDQEEEEECSDQSPVSTLCFGGGPGRGAPVSGPGNPRARAGCYASIFKVLMLRDA